MNKFKMLPGGHSRVGEMTFCLVKCNNCVITIQITVTPAQIKANYVVNIYFHEKRNQIQFRQI